MADDCDPWSEHETPWHLGWKEAVPEEWREVVIGRHRADIRSSSGLVVELQHSSISVDEIEERERFYGRMIWVFDAAPFIENVHLRKRDGFYSFRWRWPRLTIASVRRPMFWDIGHDLLLEIRKIGSDCPLGGWGYLRTKQRLVNRITDRPVKPDDFDRHPGFLRWQADRIRSVAKRLGFPDIAGIETEWGTLRPHQAPEVWAWADTLEARANLSQGSGRR